MKFAFASLLAAFIVCQSPGAVHAQSPPAPTPTTRILAIGTINW